MAFDDRHSIGILGFNTEDEFDQSTCYETGCKMCGEVMVQEELATHDIEGDVVSSPGEEEETCRVVEA